MSQGRWIVAALAVAALCACHGGKGRTDLPGDPDDTRPFDRIAPEDVVHFTGTEPFWGGEVRRGVATYSTPDNADGAAIRVDRFAGRGGVSFSGTYLGAPFVLMVSEGTCSDGMSDRIYPFNATLQVGGAELMGCAWTDRVPLKEPKSP